MKMNKALMTAFLDGKKPFLRKYWTLKLLDKKGKILGKSDPFKFFEKNNFIHVKGSIEIRIIKSGLAATAEIAQDIDGYKVTLTVGAGRTKDPRYDPKKIETVIKYDEDTGEPYEIKRNPEPEYFYSPGELIFTSSDLIKGSNVSLIIDQITMGGL